MLSVVPLLLLEDNYAYVLVDTEQGTVGVVDPSEADPVLAYLQDAHLQLDYILNTHHHWDHVNGNVTLKAETGCQVVGFQEDADRIPGIDIALAAGDSFSFGEHDASILHIPGHTSGAIAFWFEADRMVFTGDTLFSLGCGRLFEGTAAQMFDSLQRLAALPEDTQVYFGHEYTAANGQFALDVTQDTTALRHYVDSLGACTTPTVIGRERQINPFMHAGDVNEFARLRELKDRY